jgi:hypothetical protein
MKMTRLVLCLALPVLFVAGCESHPQTSGFLNDSEKMTRGQFVEYWWAAGKIDRQTLAKIYIEPVDVTRIHDYPEISTAYASNFLAKTVAYRIPATTSYKIADQPSDATARLSLAITYMTPGSDAARQLAGELGAGHSVVQVDGKLSDANGKDLACFSDRRNDSGSIGFEDLGGDAGQRLVRRTLDSITYRFVKEITNSVGQ